MNGPPSGLDALVLDDAGEAVVPTSPDEWDTWVSAGRTRHYLEADPLLDWLNRYGPTRGFRPDDELEGFDVRTDMRTFILERGRQFEDAVLALIRPRVETIRIGEGWRDAQDLARANATFEAMREGVEIIEQAVLRNPANRTYGAVDLLVRSDVLDRIVPETLTPEEAVVAAPAFGGRPWHYRAVDIKFHTFGLLKDGHAGGDERPYMAQAWVYNEALGRLQGYTPPAAFLLGRCWSQGRERGIGCLERLARVERERQLHSGPYLAELVEGALAWVRRMRRDGSSWDVLPEPSVPELYPHMRNQMDAPWHEAKQAIAAQLAELTLLPGMNPERRRVAHLHGLRRWDDPAVHAAGLGLVGSAAEKCDAVLAANRAPGGEVVFPTHLVGADPAWRAPAKLELYVDFETVSNLADDFAALPTMGGQPLIFQIGCGRLEAGRWAFEQWTVERLREPDEAAIIRAWVSHLEALRAARGLGWEDVRVVHWSPAEESTLVSAYNSAARRHPEEHWPEMPWFDALQLVVRAEPVTVRGAFNFGLKSIAKAMHVAGLIETSWSDGPADGLGAMIGAWWCDGEAARVGGSMRTQELMAEIGRYNEVDCRVMADVLTWLRANR
ncbi:MAG: hypothetical protein ACXVAP_06790 [Candidatus Limnocylindrales bacterium]